MSKTKIVLASLLKPVTEPRMYEKFGISIAGTNKYEVHIVGFKSTLPITSPAQITFHPIFNFKRLSFSRVVAPWKYYKKLLEVKPHIIIINTHDFLIVSCLYRILFGAELLYDVQENYFRNLWFQNNYPAGIKHVLALLVRSKEWITRPFISHYILAERAYREEMPFTKKNFTFIENKFKPTGQIFIQKTAKREEISLIYSGTIAENYGIFEAVVFTNLISKYKPVKLTIIGFCPNEKTLLRLKSAINVSNNIELIGGNQFVPYNQVLEAILKADYALTPYLTDKSTENCIPTKFYEYLALKIPVIYPSNNKIWKDFFINIPSLSIDFQHIDHLEVINWLKSIHTWSETTPTSLFWASEEQKLLDLLQKFI